MSEKPSWLRVVGGTDIDSTKKQEAADQTEEIEISDTDLVGKLVYLWMSINDNKPADFVSSIKPLLYNDAIRVVSNWSIDQLHDYLSKPNLIWQKPSFTKAVLDEITTRMKQGRLR